MDVVYKKINASLHPAAIAYDYCILWEQAIHFNSFLPERNYSFAASLAGFRSHFKREALRRIFHYSVEISKEKTFYFLDCEAIALNKRTFFLHLWPYLYFRP